MSIRVVLADDHVVVRQALRALLEREGLEVVGEAADGRAAARQAIQLRPDIAVLDISMPLFNGLDAAREILRSSLSTRVLVLTHHDETEYVAEALRCGVQGYVLKKQAANELVRAIQQVHGGQIYLSPGVSGAIAAAYGDARQPVALSVRERQVLQLIAEGKSTRVMAGLMGVSVKTIESHRARLMGKLDIHEIAGLVRYAIRQGLIQP
ncbi:MAG: response regulator transcription factor [Gammaproteobacteria bacterium]|nr:response regulator transcription factor [Gammaproteobacteria bacterium]